MQALHRWWFHVCLPPGAAGRQDAGGRHEHSKAYGLRRRLAHEVAVGGDLPLPGTGVVYGQHHPAGLPSREGVVQRPGVGVGGGRDRPRLLHAEGVAAVGRRHVLGAVLQVPATDDEVPRYRCAGLECEVRTLSWVREREAV